MMNPVAISVSSFKKACPVCRNDDIRRSRHKKLDLPLFLLGFIPMRCPNCDHRFFWHRIFFRATA